MISENLVDIFINIASITACIIFILGAIICFIYFIVLIIQSLRK